MLEKTGVPSREQVESAFPSLERLKKGPVAIVECFQNIPCNPCATACKKEAIKPFEDINDLPNVDHEACNGCSMCVFKCPGLSIMVVDYTYSEEEAKFKIPYEFLPLPEVGQEVKALDREGQEIGVCRVVDILNHKMVDKTPVVSVAVDKSMLMSFKNIRVVK